MPFFIKGKRKKPPAFTKNSTTNGFKEKKSKKTTKADSDEEISSDSDEDVKVQQDYKYSSDEEAEETVQEKKVRLANKYLEEIAREEKKRLEADEVDRDIIAARLKDDVLEQAGKLRKALADSISGYEEPVSLKCKEHSRPVTCCILSPDNQLIFSASDDFNIIKWSLSDRKKLCVIKRTSENGHTKKILALTISSDQKFFVSADAEAKIKVWNPSDFSFVHTFTGHRIDVTGVVFRKETHQLFSCSSDKTVKIWNLDEMMYVETLYGHQNGITGIDALSRDRAVTAGGRDNTLRIWKVVEESHLVLNGHKEALDCVRLLDEEHMVSGGEDGYVCLWSSLKKKPVCSLPAAHGPDSWIICVATCLYTDLFASGSNNGEIQVYKVETNLKSFSKLLTIQVEGNINALTFTTDGKFIIAAVGREHRLGRWTTVPKARNGIVIIPLSSKNTS